MTTSACAHEAKFTQRSTSRHHQRDVYQIFFDTLHAHHRNRLRPHPPQTERLSGVEILSTEFQEIPVELL